ncbi:hypothetical protein COB57_01535 [Candidatus Peregrinibacteria bacterium]|nr:MAG: hypothetical protein COB57_01535 [Candidatus Peregrinibacteria bacterium]
MNLKNIDTSLAVTEDFDFPEGVQLGFQEKVRLQTFKFLILEQKDAVFQGYQREMEKLSDFDLIELLKLNFEHSGSIREIITTNKIALILSLPIWMFLSGCLLMDDKQFGLLFNMFMASILLLTIFIQPSIKEIYQQKVINSKVKRVLGITDSYSDIERNRRFDLEEKSVDSLIDYIENEFEEMVNEYHKIIGKKIKCFDNHLQKLQDYKADALTTEDGADRHECLQVLKVYFPSVQEKIDFWNKRKKTLKTFRDKMMEGARELRKGTGSTKSIQSIKQGLDQHIETIKVDLEISETQEELQREVCEILAKKMVDDLMYCQDLFDETKKLDNNTNL